jgi:hypothetical protein
MKHAICILVTFLAIWPTFGAEIPPELERLNEQRARQIAEIDKIYMRQLELLKTKFTKAGNLDAANQVVAILDKMAPAKEAEKETRWVWGDGNELVLLPNGVATHTSWIKNGKWRKDADGLIRLESDVGLKSTIRIDGNKGIVEGSNFKFTIKRKDNDS